MGPIRVLVSNDDGIAAPGIVALVSALGATELCDVYVSAPAQERSASSHAITLGQHITGTPVAMQGAVEAYAIDGKPADCTMLALHGPLFQIQQFDLVVSGINRGDNLGLHVIYSGTVGAAEEAAIKGVPAIAVSLDNYKALTPDGFKVGAAYIVAFVQALCTRGQGAHPQLSHLTNAVININIPAQDPFHGFYLAHQGSGIVDLNYQQVTKDTMDQKEGHMLEAHGNEQQAKTSNTLDQCDGVRTFRNFAGDMRWDMASGSDSWAVKQGWVSITPLGLRSDVIFSQELSKPAHSTHPELIQTVTAAMHTAAHSLGVNVGGTPKL
ncbi:hypothetical protein WJX77_009801 [Trebouxia sp. C0004]